MLRLTSFLLLCFAVTLGWATPIGKALGERDPEYNLDLFEGDIMGVNPGEKPKSAVVDPTLLWPDGIVYYTVDEPAFTAQELATLYEAFAIYEANSCIRFVKRTTEVYYVSVQKTGGGCYSYIGRRPRILQPQTLSLDAGCFRCTATGCKPGTPQHEFLHALGFYHEQSRTDRDDYVTINYDNIQPGYENNFESYGTDVITDQGFPYDYGSVMHYSAYAFAVDPAVPTIIVPDGVTIGQRDGFSELDLAELNKLYGCAAKNNEMDLLDLAELNKLYGCAAKNKKNST